MNIEALYNLYLQHPQITTDSRNVKAGDLYFALKGDTFNGNQFALESLEKGAAYAIIDEDIDANNTRLIKVPDVLTCLQQLAGHHRNQFTIPFIAITGSNGKTTTKELVSAVLSTHFITYTTQGNLNNHIGIPLTILRIQPNAQIAVIEMGANHQHEIEGYCQYAQPTHGIITNCGKAHLEGFGGEEGVKKGKGELFQFLSTHNGTAFAFADYDYLHDLSQRVPHVIWYGTTSGIIQGKVEHAMPFLKVNISGGIEMSVATQLVGNYNLPNVVCAATIGHHFGVPADKIKMAIENYVPSNSRSQLIQWRNNEVILDAYNANPSSMQLAIENFAQMPGEHKILMLGAMMELGESSIEEHKALVHLIQQYPWEQVVLVGGDFSNIQHPYLFFPTASEAKIWLEQQQPQLKQILLKGSRSMQMEKVIS
ncbi:MAG: UDP-N-acetylmuramoyl-tripeptide--D-alanyl-D-alanine ligase [Sediminibacterium sp.]|nr:UDP-N-acetylmuramoyl-tripeptide--D-alanyl-D-alanine ligase [Sediminibacterium sp.]